MVYFKPTFTVPHIIEEKEQLLATLNVAWKKFFETKRLRWLTDNTYPDAFVTFVRTLTFEDASIWREEHGMVNESFFVYIYELNMQFMREGTPTPFIMNCVDSDCSNTETWAYNGYLQFSDSYIGKGEMEGDYFSKLFNLPTSFENRIVELFREFSILLYIETPLHQLLLKQEAYFSAVYTEHFKNRTVTAIKNVNNSFSITFDDGSVMTTTQIQLPENTPS